MKGAFALLLLIGAVFAAAWFVDFTMSPAERQALATQSQGRAEQWRSADAAEKAIKQTLRDPDSAKFDRESVHYRCDPKAVNPCIPVVAVCGELNAKNGFGAYVGAVRFIFIEGQPTMFETKSAGFAPVWRQLCT